MAQNSVPSGPWCTPQSAVTGRVFRILKVQKTVDSVTQGAGHSGIYV